MSYTKEELEACLKDAFSIENRDAHGKAGLGVRQIGTVQRGNKLVDVYEDTERNYWYSNRFLTDHGIVSEFEYIFGHPERRQSQRKIQW